jgi:hypothetical protein
LIRTSFLVRPPCSKAHCRSNELYHIHSSQSNTHTIASDGEQKSNSDQDIKFISTQKQKKRNSQYDTSQPAPQSHLNDMKKDRRDDASSDRLSAFPVNRDTASQCKMNGNRQNQTADIIHIPKSILSARSLQEETINIKKEGSSLSGRARYSRRDAARNEHALKQ